MHPLTLYALEVSEDREREINAERLLAEQRRLLSDPDNGRRLAVVRHPVALVLAALSRGSAAAVRRLDECVADDLGRALSPPNNRPPVALPRPAASSAAGRASRTGGVPLPEEGPMTSGTAAVSWGADRIDLFWVDADGALLHRAFDGDDGARRSRSAGRWPRRRPRPPGPSTSSRSSPSSATASCGTATGTVGRGTPGRSLGGRARSGRHRPRRRGAPTASTSGRPASTG